MTSELLWHAAAVLFGLFAFMDFLVLVWLAIHSRRWEGAHQAALLEDTRKEVDIVRSNLSRVHNEHLTDRHEAIESSSRIWEELRRIGTRLDLMRCPLQDPKCPLKVIIEPDAPVQLDR